jgi:hypothetical protein
VQGALSALRRGAGEWSRDLTDPAECGSSNLRVVIVHE